MLPPQKSIVLWGGNDLLDSSIESILTVHSDWKVVCVPGTECLDTLNQVIENTNPSIVIIRCKETITQHALPIQLIHDHPAINVITLGFENNTMEVYSKQTITINQVSDLISILADRI